MNTARFLKYFWPFYNVVHERVNSGCIHYDAILQNATADTITKCGSCFLTECDKSLSHNVSGFSLRVLLQNLIVIKKCDDFIKKRNSDYKMGRLIQYASV